jgi:hypothetical protein
MKYEKQKIPIASVSRKYAIGWPRTGKITAPLKVPRSRIVRERSKHYPKKWAERKLPFRNEQFQGFSNSWVKQLFKTKQNKTGEDKHRSS